jgi:hypothetical protein
MLSRPRDAFPLTVPPARLAGQCRILLHGVKILSPPLLKKRSRWAQGFASLLNRRPAFYLFRAV